MTKSAAELALNKVILWRGGIKSYYKSTQMVEFGDGSNCSIEYLASACEMAPSKMERIIEKTVPVTGGHASLAGTEEAAVAAVALAGMRDMGIAMKKVTDAMGRIPSAPSVPAQISADVALSLILAEVRKSDDIPKAAGQWLTRFTNEVMKITRETEDD